MCNSLYITRPRQTNELPSQFTHMQFTLRTLRFIQGTFSLLDNVYKTSKKSQEQCKRIQNKWPIKSKHKSG